MTSSSRLGRDMVKRRYYDFFSSFWTFMLGLAGRVMTPKMHLAAPAVYGRVLFLAPHPDDELMGGGGALIAHTATGADVRVAYLTDGRGSRALGLDPDEMARRRKEEARLSAGILSTCVPAWFGFHEGRWETGELAAGLAGLLVDFRPDLVYAPSRIDFHPEHRKAAAGLAAALQLVNPEGLPRAVRIYPVQVPLTPLLANCLVTVAGNDRRLEEALKSYRTQQVSLLPFWRMRRYAGALHRCGGFAEEFLELTPEAYIQINEGSRGGHRLGSFRGVRPNPTFDILAYLQGARERRRIAAEIRKSAVKAHARSE